MDEPTEADRARSMAQYYRELAEEEPNATLRTLYAGLADGHERLADLLHRAS